MIDEALVDNDIVLKCAIFEIAIWDPSFINSSIKFSILTSTRFVVAKLITRHYKNLDDVEGVRSRLDAFLASLHLVEPSSSEVTFAAQLEEIAQRDGLFFDTGEALLISIMILRPFRFFITGDKRAIKCLPRLSVTISNICKAMRRIICLETLIKKILEIKDYDNLRTSVCKEADADKGLAIIFQCYSHSPTRDETTFGLDSNLRDIYKTSEQYLLNDILFLSASP